MSVNTPLGDTLDGFLSALLEGRSAVTRWKRFADAAIYSKVGADLSAYDVAGRVAELGAPVTGDALPRPAPARRARAVVHPAQPAAWRSMRVPTPACSTPRGRRGRRAPGVLVAGHNINLHYQYETRLQFADEPDYIDSMAARPWLDTDHAGVGRGARAHGARPTRSAAPVPAPTWPCATRSTRSATTTWTLRRHRRGARLLADGPARDGADGRDHVQSFNDDAAAGQPALRQRPRGLRALARRRGAGARGAGHARQRGARIYAEVLGVEANSDGSHLPQPSEEGQRRVMTALLRRCRHGARARSTTSARTRPRPRSAISPRFGRIKRLFGTTRQRSRSTRPSRCSATPAGRRRRSRRSRRCCRCARQAAPLDQHRRARPGDRPRRVREDGPVTTGRAHAEELVRVRRHQLRQPVQALRGLRPMNFFVTGGSRGIGAQIVRDVCEAGHDVAFTYLGSEREAQAVVEQARASCGRRHAACRTARRPRFAAGDRSRGRAVLEALDAWTWWCRTPASTAATCWSRCPTRSGETCSPPT